MSYSLDLQKALHDAVKAAGLAIYDTVPAGASFPYVSFGPSDEIEADADCIEAAEVTQQLNIWSRRPGFVEARQIAEVLRDAIHQRELAISDSRTAETSVQSIRYLRDPDGLTTHAVVTILSTIERAS